LNEINNDANNTRIYILAANAIRAVNQAKTLQMTESGHYLGKRDAKSEKNVETSLRFSK